MGKFDLRRRDYVSLLIILLLGYYGMHLNAQLKAIENNVVESDFNTEDQTEEGKNINDFITLYFAGPNAEYLIGEKRNIKDISPKRAIQALIEGPKSKNLWRTLPPELEVSGVSVKDDIAYVYIHESVPLSRHGNYGSSTSTTYIINSISATLILHEPFGIKKVKLEGDINDLLVDAVKDIPYGVDMNLIKEE